MRGAVAQGGRPALPQGRPYRGPLPLPGHGEGTHANPGPAPSQVVCWPALPTSNPQNPNWISCVWKAAKLLIFEQVQIMLGQEGAMLREGGSDRETALKQVLIENKVKGMVCLSLIQLWGPQGAGTVSQSRRPSRPHLGPGLPPGEGGVVDMGQLKSPPVPVTLWRAQDLARGNVICVLLSHPFQHLGRPRPRRPDPVSGL